MPQQSVCSDSFNTFGKYELGVNSKTYRIYYRRFNYTTRNSKLLLYSLAVNDASRTVQK